MVIWDGYQHLKKLHLNRPAQCPGQLCEQIGIDHLISIRMRAKYDGISEGLLL